MVMVLAAIITIVAVARRPDAGTTDFQTFYQSGRQFLANSDPYVPFDPNRGPNLNPPWIVAMLAPLCRAPLAVAVAVWWAFSFVCFAVAVVLIAREAAPGHAVAIASSVLVTQAAYANLRLGQVAWPLLLLVTAAWIADRSRKPVWCGVFLGLAASWKPFLLVFVPYLMWRREWRALLSMAAVWAITIAIGVVAVGTAGYASWVSMLRLVGWSGHPLNASLRALLTRALAPATLAEQPTTPIVDAPGLLDPLWLIAVVVVIAIVTWRIASTRDRDVAWAALTFAALLISPLGWIHYVPIAAGPLAAVLIAGGPGRRRAAAIGWLLLCVPFAWLKASVYGPFLTVTLVSSYTWGTLLLFAAAIAVPRQQR